MALEDLKKYIGQAEEQLKPALQSRIEQLAKKEREEQLWGAEKLQQAGRFTSGFRTDWMERVMDIYEGYRAAARGETGEKALSLAQFLYGLAKEAEQAELDRAMRARELAQQATLTRENLALQRYLGTLGRGAGGGAGGGSAPTPTYRPPTVDTSRQAYEQQKKTYQTKKVTGYPPSAAIFNIPPPTVKKAVKRVLTRPKTVKGITGGAIY